MKTTPQDTRYNGRTNARRCRYSLRRAERCSVSTCIRSVSQQQSHCYNGLHRAVRNNTVSSTCMLQIVFVVLIRKTARARVSIRTICSSATSCDMLKMTQLTGGILLVERGEYMSPKVSRL